jgi:hypothetical protein
LLQNASNFSIAHEHQFYLDWLKDLKSVLWSFVVYFIFNPFILVFQSRIFPLSAIL